MTILIKKAFTIFILSVQCCVLCQTTGKQKKEKLGPYQDSIGSFYSRLRVLDRKNDINITTDPVSVTTTASNAKIIDQPNSKGQPIISLPPNTSLKVYKYLNGDYWLVSRDTIKGYIKNNQLEENEVMSDIIYTHKLESLTERFDKTSAVKILNHEVWPGMSHDMAIESKGQPLSRERVMGYFGRRERWNYSNFYLVFENNFLIFWQNI